MATYTELLQAAGDTNLLIKIRVATFVAASNILTEDVGTPNHPNRLLWAKEVFNDPTDAANKMLWPVLAQNRNFTLPQIMGASDIAVQDAVNNAVNVFANGA